MASSARSEDHIECEGDREAIGFFGENMEKLPANHAAFIPIVANVEFEAFPHPTFDNVTLAPEPSVFLASADAGKFL